MAQAAQNALDKVRLMVGLAEEPEPDLLDEMTASCKLTRMQRLYGFAGCVCLGIFLSCLSTLFIWTLKFTKFAVTYTMGNMVGLASSGFLVGPMSQCKNMFKGYRIGATMGFLFFMVMTLVSAFYLQSAPATLLCVVCQSAALLWYTLSYIPYARTLAKKLMGTCMPSLDEL